MKREEHEEKITELYKTTKNLALQLPTSFGKTKITISLLKTVKPAKVLVVVPKLVLMDTWRDEFKKWKYNDENVIFSTYVSLFKHAGNWDIVIFDEAHHFSERCAEAYRSFNVKSTICLSATLKFEQIGRFKSILPDLLVYKVTVKEAINEKILPDPTVYFLKLHLSTFNDNRIDILFQDPKGTNQTIICKYEERYRMRSKYPRARIIIKATQCEAVSLINNDIEYWKRQAETIQKPWMRNKYLKLCGDRLKMLSEFKENLIKYILKTYRNQRILTFCSDIDQTMRLGANCINSKNKESDAILDAFNNGKIKHITACNMLNEGVNLINCRIGIYAVLNSSEIMVKQKLGRILRHEKPIIIIPYYENTREEEICKKMAIDYNPELCHTITNINEIVL